MSETSGSSTTLTESIQSRESRKRLSESSQYATNWSKRVQRSNANRVTLPIMMTRNRHANRVAVATFSMKDPVASGESNRVTISRLTYASAAAAEGACGLHFRGISIPAAAAEWLPLRSGPV